MKLPDDDLKRSKHVRVVLSVLKYFKCKLYGCICWLIVKLSQNLPEERNTAENLQQDNTITGSKYFTSSS